MINPDKPTLYRIIYNIFGKSTSIATKMTKDVIVVNDESFCPTLCIDKRGIIYVNEKFWYKNVVKEIDAKILLMHEVYHAILADTLQLECKDTGIDAGNEHAIKNFAMDMRINAAIYHTMLAPNGYQVAETVLTRVYKDTGMEALLRYSSKIKPINKFYLLYNSLYPQRHRATGYNIQNEGTIRNTLKRLLDPSAINKMQTIVLLGNHSDEDDEQGDQGISPGVEDTLKEELINAILENFGCDDKANDLTKTFFKLVEDQRSLKTSLLANFSCARKINQIKSMFPVPRRIQSVIPIRPCSRDIAMMAAGYMPVLWKNNIEVQKTKTTNVAIYLDVSGSVNSHLPKILRVITSVSKEIDTIFCFSTKIEEQSVQELSKGEVKTTGGTDFNIIAEHASTEGYNKIVIFTDGYASIHHKQQEIARRDIEDCAIVYFGSQPSRTNFWETHYKKPFLIEELLNV